MIAWIRSHVVWLAIGGSLAAAAASGFLASTALGVSTAPPAKTVTIDVATGPEGPAGPPGPKGDPGAPGDVASCPTGYTAGQLVINAPGGHVTLWTCLQD